MSCEFGCINGACLIEPPCKDSDVTSEFPDGRNFSLSGSVTIKGDKIFDFCLDNKALLENICIKDGVTSERYVCPYGCSNGACLRESCAGFGEAVYGYYENGPLKCCGNLEAAPWGCSIEQPKESVGVCVEAWNCGNGICDGKEDSCNCKDCVVELKTCNNNGIPEAGEGCDDGDRDNGDGCSADCIVEDKWSCVPGPSVCIPESPQCRDGCYASTSVCTDGFSKENGCCCPDGGGGQCERPCQSGYSDEAECKQEMGSGWGFDENNCCCPKGSTDSGGLVRIQSVINASFIEGAVAIPIAQSQIGAFTYKAAPTGEGVIVIDGIVFNVDAPHVNVHPERFMLYSSSDPNVLSSGGDQPFQLCYTYNYREELLLDTTSGSLLVKCPLGDPKIKNVFAAGENITFILDGYVHGAYSHYGTPSLQVSLTNFTDGNLQVFGPSPSKSHIMWHRKGKEEEQFLYFDNSETVVRSTRHDG